MYILVDSKGYHKNTDVDTFIIFSLNMHPYVELD